jgi:hypothetical protein
MYLVMPYTKKDLQEIETTNVDSQQNHHVAPWILSKDNLELVNNVILTIRKPIGYSSSLRKLFTIDGQLTGMKTRDHHDLLKVHITNVVMI